MERLVRELNQIKRIHDTQADYEKSLVLLGALKTGEVSLDQVTLVENGWTVNEPVRRPQAVPVPALDPDPVAEDVPGEAPVEAVEAPVEANADSVGG